MQNTTGMLEKGNIDLNNRPMVKNPDGSISTVLSMSANFDGKEYLIPMVSDEGKILTEDQAIDYFKKTKKHLGVFDSPDSATKYAQQLHREQEKQYVGTEKPLDLDNFNLDEIVSGNPPRVNGLNFSVPFLKSYNITDPITNTQIQPNASGNTWQYPYINNGLPAEMVTPEPVPQVGFWENFRHAAAKSNSLVQGYKFLTDDDQTTYPADEVVPDGWTAKKPESVEGFPDDYWDYLTSATSPYDLHARQQKARQQMQEDEKFAHGGLFSSLLGGLAGTVTDPLTYLLPMATGIKYTTLTSNVARNLLRAQPGFALSSLSTAGLEEANRVGNNLQHLAKNAVIDYAFTNVLAGVGFGAGFYRDEMTRMYGLRNLMKIPPEGIKVDFETKAVEGGGEQFTGKVVLRPIPGVAMSAQKLDAATLYANEVMAQTGLFNTVVGKNLQDFLGWGVLASPVLKAANSEYNSVRAFFNRIAPISIRTTGEMEGQAVPFTAYEIATRIQDEGKKFNLFLKDKYFEANGITGANTAKGQAILFARHWQDNLTISEEEFNIEVARRLTEEGYVSKYSQCNEVGDALHEHFKGIGKRFADATGNEMFLDPINAFRYLPMNYWIPAIRNNEKGFWETIANQFALQDERIEKLQGPIKGHISRIDSLKNEIKALKEVNPKDRKILNLQNQIDLEQKNLELAEDRLVQELRDNKKNHVLLEDRVYFNTGEIKQLEELLKPVKTSEQKLSKQEEELKFAENRLKENIQQIKSIEESKRLGAKSMKLGDVQQEIENINQELKTKINDLNKKSEPIKNRQNKTLTDLKTKRDRIKADIRQAKTDKDVKAIAKNKQKLENIQTKILKESEGIKKSKADLRDQILNFRNEAATAKKEMRKKLLLAKKLSGKVQSAALDLDFLRDEQTTLRREVEVQQARFDRASNEYKNLKMELDELARNGRVDKKFFKEYGNEISFHEPKKPKLRAVFNSHDERILEAKKIMESIYNESPADILANVFGNQEPGLVTNPNYLKSRSVMIDQTELLGFMDPDLRKTINNYSSVMGKMIGVKEALPEFAKGPAFEGVILNMKLEYDTKKRELEDKILNGDFTKEQANKMRNKLDKNFDKEQKFMKDTLATYFGTYGGNKNPEIKKVLTGFRNLVAASKLGNVPLYIMQEFAGLMMKQGLMPFLSQGLGPLLRGIAQPKTAEEKIAMKEMASHAYIGMHSTFEAYTSKFINESEMSYPPVNTASENFGRITEKIAAVSQALYGTTMIANAEEAMVANAGQSEIMSWCYKYLDGTITDVQRQKAARYGLDLPNDAQIFVNNFENTPGAKKINDGYLSMYHKWQDAAAVEKMAMSMRRMVQDQVVQANKFTSPYWAQNEFLSTFFMFHGWAYGYLTKYAIPFMQRPDAEQAIGIALMTSMGMGIEAFRRFSNGKEMYDDDTKWHEEALKSLMDSGMIAGPYWQYAVELNNYLGVIPNTGPERFKNRKGLGQFNPILGYLDGARTVFQHTLRGDLTKGDMLTLQGLLPGMSAIPFRKAIGDYIRNSTLPDKRNEAAPWSWLQSEQ